MQVLLYAQALGNSEVQSSQAPTNVPVVKPAAGCATAGIVIVQSADVSGLHDNWCDSVNLTMCLVLD